MLFSPSNKKQQESNRKQQNQQKLNLTEESNKKQQEATGSNKKQQASHKKQQVTRAVCQFHCQLLIPIHSIKNLSILSYALVTLFNQHKISLTMHIYI